MTYSIDLTFLFFGAYTVTTIALLVWRGFSSWDKDLSVQEKVADNEKTKLQLKIDKKKQ